MQNLCKHQLSSVCLIVPYYLELGNEFEIRILVIQINALISTFFTYFDDF
jgi:hypothetical protein